MAEWTADRHRQLARAARAQAASSWPDVARALLTIAEDHEAEADKIDARVRMPPPNQ